MDLTPDNIFGLLQSADEFPVDFEDAWRWIGYSRKNNAKAALLSAGFIEGTDFRVLLNNQQNPTGGRPVEQILLTVDCFKSFAMMAGTPRGHEVRLYFIHCEKQLKALLEQRQQRHKGRVLKLVVQDQPDTWAKRFDDEYFDEAYRITGWKRTAKGHPSCMGRFVNETIYDHMPEGTSEELRRVNPKNENGNRSRKHHQHLTSNLGVPILATQKAATLAVMRLSPANNPERFKRNMVKACGTHIQLDFLDDFDQLDEAS